MRADIPRLPEEEFGSVVVGDPLRKLVAQGRFRGRIVKHWWPVLLLVVVAVGCSADNTPIPDNLEDAVRFEDPDGGYTLIVSSEWPTDHDLAIEGMEMWYVAPDPLGLGPDLNAFSEEIPADMTLDGYVQLSIENAPLLLREFEVIGADIITGHDGQPLARLEYDAVPPRLSRTYRNLAIMSVRPGRAATVTWWTAVDEFDGAVQAEIEEYMRTLKVSG